MALVLVVEDDHALCEIYSKILEKVGVDTLIASDGIQALDILDDYIPDVIFLDILLPRMNGLEVLQHIANDNRLRSTQVVVITANPRFEQDVRAIHTVEFRVKPVHPGEIRNLVANAQA